MCCPLSIYRILSARNPVDCSIAECTLNSFTEQGIERIAAHELVLEFRGIELPALNDNAIELSLPVIRFASNVEIVRVTGCKEQDIEIVSIQPLGFTIVCQEMDPFVIIQLPR